MFCSSADHWLQLGIDLKKKEIALPCLWLGDDKHFDAAKNFFGADVTKMLSDLRLKADEEINIEYSGSNSDFFLSEQYIRAKDICLKMMDRLDAIGSMTRLDREVWFHQVIIWALNHFESKMPDFFINVRSFTQSCSVCQF